MDNKMVLDKLNEQYNFEIESAYIYKAMALWAEKENWVGVANFLTQQALEEMSHAKRLERYLMDIGFDVKLKAVPQPEADYENLLDVFKKALAHEKIVTSNFDEIMKDTKEAGDYRTEIQVHWFITEQVEEEATFEELIALLEKIDNSVAGLLQFDAKLGQRNFSAEASQE
ncbi:MAG: ferritin [Lagierella massiliensis]|nr:ferritin [Lagierella massiliensis]